MATYKCQRCKEPFEAREADRKRGWARFCGKSCKAKEQESRTGQYRAYKERTQEREDDTHDVGMECVEAGWDGYKDVF